MREGQLQQPASCSQAHLPQHIHLVSSPGGVSGISLIQHRLGLQARGTLWNLDVWKSHLYLPRRHYAEHSSFVTFFFDNCLLFY